MPARELRREDLASFDLAKYQSRELFDLSLSGWCQVLEDRLLVRRMLQVGKIDQAVDAVAAFFVDPVHRLGARSRQRSPAHATDTASIRFVRVEQLQALAAISESSSLDPSLPFDLALHNVHPESKPRYAHVRIDVAAPQSVVIEDLRRFLAEAYVHYGKPAQRRYGPSTLREWVSSKYLPYYDLDLYAAVHVGRISTKLYVDLLELRNATGAPDSDLIKTPENCLKVFTDATLAAMKSVKDAEAH